MSLRMEFWNVSVCRGGRVMAKVDSDLMQAYSSKTHHALVSVMGSFHGWRTISMLTSCSMAFVKVPVHQVKGLVAISCCELEKRSNQTIVSGFFSSAK